MKGVAGSGFKVPLPENAPPMPLTASQEWILTTYLDATVRVARGDGGTVFVLTKDASSS